MKENELTLVDDHWCFACGAQNPHGLHLTDFRFEGSQYVCTFTAQRHHQGWAGVTHGGILGTLLDEIMTRMLWQQGVDVVTGEISIRYHAPVKTGQSLTVRGWINRKHGKLVETEARLELPDGSAAAVARGKFVQV